MKYTNMKTQSDWDEFYLKTATLIAQQSYAQDRKVGSLIVKDDNIIAFSYNGTLPGQDNCTTDASGRTLSKVLHAETQAIAKVAKSTQSTDGATMYSTLSPCIECAKLIAQVGIVRLVYRDAYKYTEGIDFLKKAKVLVNETNDPNRFATPEWLAKSGLL
jgi:dCMP deaminase